MAREKSISSLCTFREAPVAHIAPMRHTASSKRYHQSTIWECIDQWTFTTLSAPDTMTSDQLLYWVLLTDVRSITQEIDLGFMQFKDQQKPANNQQAISKGALTLSLTAPFEFMHSQVDTLCLPAYHPSLICSLSKHTKLTLFQSRPSPLGFRLIVTIIISVPP